MKNLFSKYVDKENFFKPRVINIVDVVLLVLVIMAFFYPTNINPWYRINEARDFADEAYGLAENAYILAEEAQGMAEDNESNISSHELWYH